MGAVLKLKPRQTSHMAEDYKPLTRESRNKKINLTDKRAPDRYKYQRALLEQKNQEVGGIEKALLDAEILFGEGSFGEIVWYAIVPKKSEAQIFMEEQKPSGIWDNGSAYEFPDDGQRSLMRALRYERLYNK